MDLEKLRAMNWAQTWRLVAEKDLVTMYGTSLADQDIFNGLLKDHPQMVCINTYGQSYTRITYLDTHSNILEFTIYRFTNYHVSGIFRFAIAFIYIV